MVDNLPLVKVAEDSFLSDARLQYVDTEDTCLGHDAAIQLVPEHAIAPDPIGVDLIDVNPIYVILVDALESFSGNTHPMVTQSKVGVFKRKTYVAKLSMVEPKNIHEALRIPSWKAAIDEEYQALIKNGT